jgi:UDP-N-acetylglucosamine diphosphorylase/glucosamine-1-phosphate N-acetyltransferase
MGALVLFDDARGDLAPLCDLRASFELRTGAVTTHERLARQAGRPVAAVLVPEGIAALVGERFEGPVNTLPAGEAFTLVNGRCPSLPAGGPTGMNSAVVDEHGDVIAANLDRAHAEAFAAGGCVLPDGVRVETVDAPRLIRRPWHVLDAMLGGNLEADLAAMAAERDDLRPFDAEAYRYAAVIGEGALHVGRDVCVQPFVAFNTIKGPIVIDHGVEINAHAVVYGPCYIGPGSVLHNRADVGYSAIGPRCKLGGEVNVCCFQGYANKSHSGYLGHSILGQWVNLGASTVTSNLKNTFGEVAMRTDPAGPPEKTGRQFLGSIIGDHARTAIGTRLTTGACVHTAAMLALSSFAPNCVPPFAFLTDDRADRYELDKFLAIADRMMQRRGQGVTPALRERIANLHAKTGVAQ